MLYILSNKNKKYFKKYIDICKNNELYIKIVIYFDLEQICFFSFATLFEKQSEKAHSLEDHNKIVLKIAEC